MTGFCEVLDRYGQEVTVCYGDGRPGRVARAVLQPVMERREDWRQEVPTPLGLVRKDRFLYLGEPEVSLEGCDCLLWDGRAFFLRNVQPIYIGEVLSHWWAMAGAESEA